MSGNVFPTPTLQWGALLQDPATSMQVATKEYVDAKVGGIPEAPTDGQTYGRDGQTATWNPITLTPLASSTAPLMDGTASAGAATVWSRGDHVHPTDTSRYAASNPSSYVNAAGAAAAAPVQSVATRTGAITLTHSDITDWTASLAPYAPLASPTFTGTPSLPTGATAVTQIVGTNNTTLATTAFVQSSVAVPSSATPLMDGTAAVGTSLLYARQDHVHPTDTSRAPLGSPALTGTPTAPTATAGTSTTQIATTAFVQAAIPSVAPASTAPLMDGLAAVGTSLLYARQDHVHPSDTSRAPLASPALTGAPTSVTPATADNSTAIATTAFVKAQGYGVPPSPATVAPLMNGTAAVGTSLLYARQDHVHPTDTALAPLGSPALTGTPTAPTATAGTNTTQLATTAFVQAALPAASSSTPLMDGTAAIGSGTTWARADHVHPTDTSRAPLASPAFTGYATIANPVPGGSAANPSAGSVLGSYVSVIGSGSLLFNAFTDGVGDYMHYASGAAAGILHSNGALTFVTTSTATAGGAAGSLLGWTSTMALDINGNLNTVGNLSIGTTLGVTGASSFNNTLTVNAGGAAIYGGFAVYTGTAYFGSNTASINTVLDGPASSARQLLWQTAGVNTWTLLLQNTQTGTGNAGGDLQLINQSDAGGNIGTPLTITRSTGLITIGNGVSFGSTFAPSATNFANQIALYGSTYGITVTSNAVNYVTPSNGNHTFYQGSTVAVNLGAVASITGNLSLTPGQPTVPAQVFSGGGVNNVMVGGTPGNGVLATTATAGYPMIPSTAGTPTGTPINGTKACALVYNTSSHSLNIYDPVAAGWYHIALTAGAG